MTYFFTDYNWIERKIQSYVPRLQTLGITDVVGISRGGIYPALLAAFALDIPKIHLLNYDRDTHRIDWQGYRALHADSVVLLCEDVAGDGRTLVDAAAYIRAMTPQLHTLTVCHFNGSAMTPDFSYDSEDVICIFPWERHSVNPEERFASRKFRKRLKKDSEYFNYGLDLDGLFLPDIDNHLYQTDLPRALHERQQLTPYDSALLPPIPLAEATIITGRPSCDFDATTQWLTRHGIACQALHMRDEIEIPFHDSDDHYTKTEKSAAAKVAHIRALGITHYYESDPLQSILIANQLPMVRVCWWNNARMIRQWIAAENDLSER